MFLGFAMVRTGVLDAKESRTLSVMSLYLFAPFAVLGSFEVDCTPDMRSALLFSLTFAIMTHIVVIALARLLAKPMKLTVVERASIIYPNSGSFIIPIVSSMLGLEWVIFTCVYMTVQLAMLWTHCRMMISGENKIELKKIFTNVNMIAIFLGIIIFFSGFKFTGALSGAVSSMAACVGPVVMLLTGMVIGGMDFKQLIAYRRAWLVVAMRLIVIPVIVTLIVKFSGFARLMHNGDLVILISLLAVSAPSSSTVLQMTQVYRGQEEAEYASTINVLSMLCCVITMPLIVALYYI